MEKHHTFLQLVFSQPTLQIGPQLFQSIYKSLKRSPEQLDQLVSPDGVGKFVCRMDVYLHRIVEFLKKAQTYLPPTTPGQDSAKFLGLLFSERLFLPLLGSGAESYEVTNRTEIFDLLLALLELILVEPPRLRRLARRLGEIPQLLGKLVSSLNSDTLGRWIDSLGENDPDPDTLSNWNDVIVQLSRDCDGDHRIEEPVAMWGVLKELMKQLYKLRNDLVETSTADLESPDADLDLMLPSETQQLLARLRLGIPQSYIELCTLIDRVEKGLAFDTLKSLTKTLPCRLCFVRCMAGSNCETDDLNGIYTIASTMQIGSAADTARESDKFDDNLGVWKIVLSVQAWQDLKRSRAKGTFYDIKFKLEDLSSGDWIRRSLVTPINRTTLHFNVRVFLAYYSNGYILWQVDRGFDERINIDSQIIKVWKIGEDKAINSTLDLVAREQKNWTKEKISSCKVNLIDKRHGVKIPATFAVNDDSHEPKSWEPDIEDRTLHDVLICGKFLRLTTRMFDNVIYGNENAVFPYDVTAKEMAIIKHDKAPTFIMGRSGTGKTTCLLYKLLKRYFDSKAMGEGYGFRQVLLTRSQLLAEKLAEELQELIKSQFLHQQQMHLTQIRNLQQSSVGKNMWDGIEKQTTETLFSLADDSFPLVCTFSHFVKILENTVRTNDGQHPAVPEHSDGGELVDFAIFKASYWPVISRAAPQGPKIDPRLIFSEFMGVIKGLASARTSFAPLSREAYCTRSTRLAPAFGSENERSAVYNMYELYEGRKRKRRDYDNMDKMITLFRKLHNLQFRRQLQGRLHEVYVDEVQDQRPIEIELLLHLVNDPRGIHFAGDSAQCISNDSAFRFENVKALFYEHYSQAFDNKSAKPKLCALAHNYRSHQGILSFASFIMSLLWKAFPTMVDKLSPEIGQYRGPMPTIFVGPKTTELLVATTRLYGSKQVIIVRDEETQRKLKSLLPGNCVVFTILQSKGMEYDDVFIYDFLSSSPCSSALLRNLEQLLPEHVDPTYASNNMAMCAELKSLYVAVTRTRQRLWMLESSLEGSNILDILTKRLSKPLINVTLVQNDKDIGSIAFGLRPSNETTKGEWIYLGTYCMEQGLLEQALQCFENAGERKRSLWVRGCLAEERGRVHRSLGATKLFREYFKEAACCFQELKMTEKAATYFEIAEEFVQAGELRSELGQHERAGKLLERGDSILRAAAEYYKADMPATALTLLFQKNHYDEVIQGLESYLDVIDRKLRKSLAWKCNTLVREGKILASLKDRAWNLLLSDDEKKDYLLFAKDYAALAQFLLSKGRFPEVFHELILAEQLSYAVEIASHGDLTWSEMNVEYLPEVYNSSEIGTLLVNLRSAGTDAAQSNIANIAHNRKANNSRWSHTWQRMMTIYGNYIENGTVPPKSDNVGWHSNLFTTLVSINAQYFLKAAESSSNLFAILTYMRDFSALLKISEGELYPTLPPATISYLGLLTMPWKQNLTNAPIYLVLSWSYLTKLKGISAGPQPNGLNILAHAYIALRNELDDAIDSVHMKAKDLIAAGGSCKWCAKLQVTWDGHIPTQPMCNHQWPYLTRTASTERLYHIMKMSCMVHEIHSHLQYPTSHGPSTHPQNNSLRSADDYWHELLLKELCYISSVQQDVMVIHDTLDKIQNEIEYQTLLGNLHYRIQHKLSLYGNNKASGVALNESLPTSLRTYRIWNILEGTHWWQQQKPKVDDLSDSTNTGDLVRLALQQYHSLKSMSLHEHSMIAPMFEIISGITTTLRECLRTRAFSSYNSGFFSVFEDIATLLIFGSRRREIVIPRSWTLLYLQYWEPLVRPTTSLREIWCQRALYRLGSSFCKLVIKLEPATDKDAPQEAEMLLRRSVDFLVIILVNLGSIVPTPRGYHELYREVQKVLCLPRMNAQSIQDLPATKLLIQLINSFKLYNDKDCLLLYKPKGTLKEPVSSQFRGLNIEVRVRPSYALNSQGTQSSDKGGDWNGDSRKREAAYIITAGYWRYRAHLERKAAYTIMVAYDMYRRKRQLKEAITVIQRVCYRFIRERQLKRAVSVIQRACYQFIRDKAHRRTAQGTALRIIQELCTEKGSAAMEMGQLERRKYLELMIIMVSEGAELYVGLEEVNKRLRAVIEQTTDESRIRELEQMETRIQAQWNKLFHRDRSVIFTLEVQNLKKICAGGLMVAGDVKQRLLDMENPRAYGLIGKITRSAVTICAMILLVYCAQVL